MKTTQFKINENPNLLNSRLDTSTSILLGNMSRSRVSSLIKSSDILVNGKPSKSNYMLKENDIIEVNVPEPEVLDVLSENIPINIVFEDDYIAIVNKEKGMVVHPAAGNYSGTLVNALMHHMGKNLSHLGGINGVIRPGIVHRIDKDTSGLIAIAKNDNAHSSLSEQLKNHTMSRTYRAIVNGIIKEDSGTINKPIARHPKDRKKMAIVSDGKEAITHFTVLERFRKHTLVEFNLETGRTHQIRVHMASLNHPIVGDTTYNGSELRKLNTNGQVLHAMYLSFLHPHTGEEVKFSCSLPEYFEKSLEIVANM